MSRSRLEILRDILNVCREASAKSRITQRANLNYKTTEIYLEILLNEKWIHENGKYKITEEGLRMLEKMEKVAEELGE